MTNKGMLDTTRFYRQNKVDGWVFLQVHDEIAAYVREDQADSLGKDLMKKGMENNDFVKLIDIPMIAEPLVCDTLKESK
jgi:DNA polymerase I-like protein with 3'-5' exonuclease and polymerase domains